MGNQFLLDSDMKELKPRDPLGQVLPSSRFLCSLPHQVGRYHLEPLLFGKGETGVVAEVPTQDNQEGCDTLL